MSELTAVVRHTAFQIAAPRVGADIGGIVAQIEKLRLRVLHLALQRVFDRGMAYRAVDSVLAQSQAAECNPGCAVDNCNAKCIKSV